MRIKKLGSIYSISLVCFSYILSSLFNITNNSIFQILLLLSITFIILFIYRMNKNEYPLIIYCISLSLLLHSSLISNYIWGWDINFEYKYSNIVLTNHIWNVDNNNPLNSMLTTVILSPILSMFTGLNLVTIFKIIFPIIFAFVPVMLYYIYDHIFSKYIAIYSTLLLIFSYEYYTEMLQLIRQQIAEFIIVLIILLYVVNKSKFQAKNNNILFLILSFALIISHYTITYLYLFVITISYIIYYVYRKNNNIKFNIPFNHILLIYLIAILWYLYSSFSKTMLILINLLTRINSILLSDLFNPQKIQALNIILNPQNTLVQFLYKFIYLFFQVMIVFGLLIFIYKNRKNLNTYYILSVVFLMFLILNLFIPYLSNSINTSRIYHISLLILSPYSIIGILSLSNLLRLKLRRNIYKIISILLIIYFCFNNGLIYYASSINNTIMLNKNIDFPIFSNQDVNTSEWFIKVNDNQTIFVDSYRIFLFYGKFYNNIIEINNSIPKNSLVYLSQYNVNNLELTISYANQSNLKQIKYEYFNSNIIYTTKNSKIINTIELYKIPQFN